MLRLRWFVAVIALGLPAAAHADEPTPAPAPADESALTEDEALAAALADAEIIELWDERPDKPFDRDTEVRLTGEELARRGAVDLASALALLPDVTVRDVGRGGWNIDIRGARKGAVRILVDGVSVSDPYYGTFDVSTLPITDIEQIRVSTTPSSPIDGPGGPGGVIEVHTRDAIGARGIRARLITDTLPTYGMSATGRTAVARDTSLRLSTSALFGRRDFELPSTASVGESRRATTGAMRLEQRRGARRWAVDAFIDDRHYLPPPSEQTANILVIDRETSGRVQASLDHQVGALQLQGRLWGHGLRRRSRSFRDATLVEVATSESLAASRVGGQALATQALGPRWRWVASLTVDHEQADVKAFTGSTTLRSTGDATLTETAAGAQYERGTARVDAAVGLAAPMGVGADPWPEAKLTARWRPWSPLEVIATLARKGRTPSLRERFDVQSGNPALDPELASHAEGRAIVTVGPVELDVAAYFKRSTGTVVADQVTNRLVNLGEVDLSGVDARVTARLGERVTLGAAYGLVRDRARADSDSPWRDDPLDRLPDHHGEASAQLRLPRAIALTARGRYVGTAIDRMQPVDSYTLADATASIAIDEWLAVVKCDDLLDAAPETRTGYRLPGRVVTVIVQADWD